MPLFTFKPKGKGKLPLEEIASMRASGMSDKDIIKKLKEMGYSYDEIEKGMLESLKDEVAESPREKAPKLKNASPTVAEVYEEPKEEVPVPEVAPETLIEPGAEAGLFGEPEPELSIEELVEGVVNEKWEVFERELRNLKFDQEKLLREIEEIKKEVYKLSEEKQNPIIEKRLNDLGKAIEDLDARISGLEKAFKQFLPSLVQNIRILSHLVSKLKEKGIK